jgi:hypothetical protein
LDFNYSAYFDKLASLNLTLTVAFSGTYVEPDSDCNPTGLNPQGNTLSPANIYLKNSSFITPWKRVPTLVAPGAGADFKFDLMQFDEKYFDRLRDFVAQASTRGVVVQLGLFCGYDATHEFIWGMSPMNPKNNVNFNYTAGEGPVVNRTTVYTLDAGPVMLSAQLGAVQRIVSALTPYDNVMIEIVFTTNHTDVKWAEAVVAAAIVADPKRLIVVPTQWMQQLFPVQRESQNSNSNSNINSNINSNSTDKGRGMSQGIGIGIVVSCGAGSNCTDSRQQFYYPPSAIHPNLLDSSGPLPGLMKQKQK